MKKNKRKIFHRLSVKIILAALAILMATYILLAITLNIIRSSGLLENLEEIDKWARILFLLFQPIFIFAVLTVFAYVINRLVVYRVYKLEEAAKKVARGNFDIRLDVKGGDELSMLAGSFNLMSAELKSNEYLSKEFIRNISHEFKTPLSAIRAYGELLEMEAGNQKIVREYADIIVKQTDRLAALSKSILQLSLLDSTTMIKKNDIFSPAEQLRDIFRLTQASWGEKNLTLDLQLEEIIITSNEQLLYQVWQNLISNAIKFSNRDGVIKVVLSKNEKGVYFAIADNGFGIKDEDKEKIFDHFYMVDKSRNTDGSGLGLAITKKIITKLGGEISVESKEGEGTKFIIVL